MDMMAVQMQAAVTAHDQDLRRDENPATDPAKNELEVGHTGHGVRNAALRAEGPDDIRSGEKSSPFWNSPEANRVDVSNLTPAQENALRELGINVGSMNPPELAQAMVMAAQVDPSRIHELRDDPRIRN